MTTVRDTIDAKLALALSNVVPAAAIEFEPEGDPAIFPGLAVFNRGDRLLEREAMLDRRIADISIEGYVTRGGGADGVADLNDLHARAIAAIMADDTLGGTVEEVDVGDLRRDVMTFSDQGRLSFAQDLTIQFVTQRRNPALPA